MKIAEVSKRYGVSTDTLRYYERIGLLRHVPRNGSGIRDYDEASCNAVEFVKCMRDLSKCRRDQKQLSLFFFCLLCI